MDTATLAGRLGHTEATPPVKGRAAAHSRLGTAGFAQLLPRPLVERVASFDLGNGCALRAELNAKLMSSTSASPIRPRKRSLQRLRVLPVGSCPSSGVLRKACDTDGPHVGGDGRDPTLAVQAAGSVRMSVTAPPAETPVIPPAAEGAGRGALMTSAHLLPSLQTNRHPGRRG